MDIDKIVGIMYSGVRPGEEGQVRELLASCGLENGNITPQKLRHFLVARRGDEILGTVGLEISGDDALLRSLAVAEGFRRRGVGRALVDAIERHALAVGVAHIYLLTLTAESFFTGQGYLVAERGSAPTGIQNTEEFRSCCLDTAVCLHKQLSPPAAA
jgi:amino-acid N-acetyltransferase